MKVFKLLPLVVLLSIVATGIAGCSGAKKFGEAITQTETTKVKDILAAPDKYAGKTVKVEGKIIQECPAGGWFYLRDNTSIIYVNLHPSNFAIPQAVGKDVIAQGQLQDKEGGIEIVGKGVEIK